MISARPSRTSARRSVPLWMSRCGVGVEAPEACGEEEVDFMVGWERRLKMEVWGRGVVAMAVDVAVLCDSSAGLEDWDCEIPFADETSG